MVRTDQDDAFEPPSQKGYVGSQACAECHQELFDSYKVHPMYNSLAEIRPETPTHVPSGETVQIKGKHRDHLVNVKDGKIWHHERMTTPTGEVIYDQSVPMKYVVGSGQRANAYLHQRGQLLFMSPLNWYSQAERWDFAPNYTSDDPRRFDRRVTDDCLSCHAGRMAPVGRGTDCYQTSPFLEEAIGCENCHGPGAEHIAFQNATNRTTTKDPIVNPANLPPTKREDVCYQCHLVGGVRVLRHGRTDFDFRPGMRMEEIWTVLVNDSNATGDGPSRAVNHVQQMRSSRCFTESEGRFGCISCHDPHRVPGESERVDFYRKKCQVCHNDSDCGLSLEHRNEKQNSCIDCHMPSGGTNNIAHVTQTEHRILRRYDASPQPSKQSGDDQLAFFDNAHKRLPAWEQDRALGLGAHLYLSKTGRPLPIPLLQKLDHVLETVPDDGATLATLGASALDHQRFPLAQSYLERAVRLPDVKEQAMEGLLKIHYLSADWKEALECSEWLTELDPGNYRAQAMRADILVNLGRLPEGIAAAEQALRFNPTLVEVRRMLVKWYQQSGQPDRSREQAQMLERMEQVLSR